MWLIENNHGNVIVLNESGIEEFRGPVSVALLGFGRAMHRMDEAHLLANALLAELDRTIEDSRPPWFDEHYTELKRLAGMLSCGAGPSHTHNAEPTP